MYPPPSLPPQKYDGAKNSSQRKCFLSANIYLFVANLCENKQLPTPAQQIENPAQNFAGVAYEGETKTWLPRAVRVTT